MRQPKRSKWFIKKLRLEQWMYRITWCFLAGHTPVRDPDIGDKYCGVCGQNL